MFWIHRVDIYVEVYWTVSVLVEYVQICIILDERLDNLITKPDDSQVQGAFKDAIYLVYISSSIDQELCGLKILLANSQANWCALVLIQHICCSFVHDQAVYDAYVTVDSRLVQNGALPVVPVVLVEGLLREVLQEGDEGALLHVVLQEQVQQLEQRVHQELYLGVSSQLICLWRAMAWRT